MGTNFYLMKEVNKCSKCGHVEDDRHIGKASGGWHFLLRIYPEEGILNLADWEKIFREEGNLISDEYGDSITAEQMLDIITGRAESGAALWCHAKPPTSQCTAFWSGSGKHGGDYYDLVEGEFC